MEGPLQLFFEKYKNLKVPNESIRKAFAEALLETTGASVDLNNISFKKGVIYLASDPYVKNEVLLNKERILSILEAKVGMSPKKII